MKKGKTYKALIDTHSIRDERWLETLDIVGEYDETWPGEEISTLHIVRVLVKDAEITKFLNVLSKRLILEGWFSVAWNEKKVFVIFKNKVVKLERPLKDDSSKWKSLLHYGERQDMAEKYFVNMKKVIREWK